jgi:hypothetical protein
MVAVLPTDGTAKSEKVATTHGVVLDKSCDVVINKGRVAICVLIDAGDPASRRATAHAAESTNNCTKGAAAGKFWFKASI